MTERESSSAGSSGDTPGMLGRDRGSGTIVAVALVVGLVVVGGVVVATSGLPGGDGSVPVNETEQNRTVNEQQEGNGRTTSGESFDPAALNTSSQAPTRLHTAVLWSNETDAGYAANHTARMAGLDNHAALIADDFEDAGFDVASSEGVLMSTQYGSVRADEAYANVSTVTITIDEDTEAFTNALDLSARTLTDSAFQGSPPATYSNTSGEALQPDYVAVRMQLSDGRMAAVMPVNVTHIRAFQAGAITPTQYANVSIGRTVPANARWKTGETTIEVPDEPPADILAPEGLFVFEDRAAANTLNYSEYDPATYEVTPNYYKDNARTGFNVDVTVHEDESLATTLPMSAYVLGSATHESVSEMRGGNGFAFIDATYYNSDGEKLAEARYAPRTVIRFALANTTAEEFATSDTGLATFNATHPDAQAVADQNMTRIVRAGQLRIWAAQYEYDMLARFGTDINVESTRVDVADEQVHIHTVIPEWPTVADNPAAMQTHAPYSMAHLFSKDRLENLEPKDGVYIYQENNVKHDGSHGIDYNSIIMFAETDAAREATRNGPTTQEAIQWASNVSFDDLNFYRGYEPEASVIFNYTLSEWNTSDRTFTDLEAVRAGADHGPPESLTNTTEDSDQPGEKESDE